jgi:hypothetical protein
VFRTGAAHEPVFWRGSATVSASLQRLLARFVGPPARAELVRGLRPRAHIDLAVDLEARRDLMQLRERSWPAPSAAPRRA